MGLADVYVDQALVRSHIQVTVSCNNLFYRASRWVCVFLSPESRWQKVLVLLCLKRIGWDFAHSFSRVECLVQLEHCVTS